MVMLKKIDKERFILVAQTHPGTPHRGSGSKNKTFRDWWTARARGDSLKGVISIGSISVPKELVGKHFKIYAKVVKHGTNKRVR
jgi:hypothetical protein